MITLKWFASLRDSRGLAEEKITPAGNSVSEIYDSFAFELPKTVIRYAVNGAFVPASFVPKDDDSVAFLPPVSGG